MKINTKRVYVTRGSEDGVIGVYTNIKKAYEQVNSYLEGITNITYANTVKQLKSNNVMIEGKDNVYCVIEPFFLNR